MGHKEVQQGLQLGTLPLIRFSLVLTFQLCHRFGDMKLIVGEPGPGFIVKPGEHLDDAFSSNLDDVSF